MITITSPSITQRVLGIAFLFALGLPTSASADGGASPCATSAVLANKSCQQNVISEFWLARAICTNLPTVQERLACTLDAFNALRDAKELCDDQHEERLDICDDLGGGIYHPIIHPADFVAGINHPYFPIHPGVTLVYEKETDEGVEHVEVTPTGKTKTILGVVCTEVRDVVTLEDGLLEDELVEDTLDWFAQDVAGNVWYFGEIAMNFENGELNNLDGSWRAGVDGAKPGIVMEAAPHVGDVYRQEFQIGEAEDIAEVFHLNVTVVVPYGTFAHCLQTEDQTALEPDIEELKHYAPGVGMVLSINVETGERTELVAIRGG